LRPTYIEVGCFGPTIGRQNSRPIL